MKFVIFGLTISSSWGNGHATLWRGLCKALARRCHRVVFFEGDVPYYALNRDLLTLPDGELCLYPNWDEAQPVARWHLADADVAMVTSYCPDGMAATDTVLRSRAAVRAFYDLDALVTLARLQAGETVEYSGPRGLSEFDLVLSYTGGRALTDLQLRLGARRVAPLYGSVDPDAYRPPRRSTAIGPICPIWALTPPTGSPRSKSSSLSRVAAAGTALRHRRGPNIRWSSPGPPTSTSCAICPPASIPASTARRGSP